jgi:hypothetical protein
MTEDTDSLKVTEQEDGTFQVEWDPNDPRYMFLNELSEDQLNDLFNTALAEQIKVWESENEPVE